MLLKIGSKEIKPGKSFIIAEVGNNHNGNFDAAVNLIDEAIRSGADCVKFQMRNLSEVYRAASLAKSGDDLGTEYIIDLLNRFELTLDQHKRLKKYCDEKQVIYLCTPWDKSVDVLESMSVLAYKVASADFLNLPLLEKLISTKKTLILSTGMSTSAEIEFVVEYLKKFTSNFILLHCNSTYPAPFADINLALINDLKGHDVLCGYSGHERGIAVSIAAVALGASVIERHITLDRTLEGPDHAASLTPVEFAQMVNGIREVEMALGGGARRLSQGQMINKESLGKSLVASRVLKKGDVVTAGDIQIKSPGMGLDPSQIERLIGVVLNRDLDLEGYFFETDIAGDLVKSKKYSFSRPWGIPVRYHDFGLFNRLVKPNFWEFHLSYSDMELNIQDFIDEIQEDSQFVVHAPELFSNGRLMDLASVDESYRKDSIVETQRVINITRELNRFFPKTVKPLIVANIGGFSMDVPFNNFQREVAYENFAKSLKELDMADVEIIPQTMAPFPWHFGGQRYQNLFLDIEEIIDQCIKLNMRICFDISHSKLLCNHLGEDFYGYAEQLLPYVAHLHIGDAVGTNGEGMQINEGEIDFDRLGKLLRVGCPDASFIPEIWQGHKNNGEGFWIALERLEGKL